MRHFPSTSFPFFVPIRHDCASSLIERCKHPRSRQRFGRGNEGEREIVDRRSSIRLSKQEQTTAAFTPPASSFPSPLFAILINSLQVFSQRDIADYFTRGCWPVQNRSRSPRLLPRSSPGTDLSSLSSSVEGTREEDRVFEIIGGANNDLGLERIRFGRGDFQSVH